MPFPTTEQYMDALQFPRKVLKDPELAAASVESTGMGLPLARSGGFALTFKLTDQGKTWALRLFQKDRKNDKLGERYGSIARAIRNSGLPYFVEFSFLPAGILIQTQTYSCVKMGWAEGVVLGTYIEKHRHNKTVLQNLRQNLQKLAVDLESKGLAHGDLQTDNILVSASGSLKLVDYDAFFTPEIRHLGAIETGYPNFQHPERSRSVPYDHRLDRFSFLVIDCALQALQMIPNLWEKLSADPQCLLVRASDFAAPHASTAFHTLALDPQVGMTYRRLAAVCEGGYQDVPTLVDFLAGRGPSAINLKPVPSARGQSAVGNVTTRPSYQSRASKVLSGENYSAVLASSGQHVEIVGKVLYVQSEITKYGKPYVFILFGPKSGKAVYIPIWSSGLAQLAASGLRPDATYVGKWISVTGVVDATYSTKGWQRTGITVHEPNMISVISETESRYRLSLKVVPPASTRPNPAVATAKPNRNAEIAAAAKAAAASRQASGVSRPANPRSTPQTRKPNPPTYRPVASKTLLERLREFFK